MRPVHLSDADSAPTLVEADISRPQPGRGELLIGVYADVKGFAIGQEVYGMNNWFAVADRGDDTGKLMAGHGAAARVAVLVMRGGIPKQFLQGDPAADSEATGNERVKQAFFIVEPNHQQLVRIGQMLDAGELRTVVDATVPLVQASSACTGEVKQRNGRGKLVVAVVAAQEGSR